MRTVLFEKSAIAGMELKNRIIMAPMGNLADTDGGFSKKQIDYYEARAKGGAGLIVSGSLAFTSLLGSPYSGIFENVRHVGRAAELADAVHRYGAKLAFQFNMGGGRCGGNISASEVPTLADPAKMCRALTVEEIHKVVAAMGSSAALAKGAGVDAIVIHAYAGYLLDQFQSSEWNHREDEYGGSLENRMRLTKELIQAVKKSCGNDYPVIVKFSVEHNTETGRKLDEGLEMCRMLEEYGADAIIADAGSFATRWNRCVPTVYEPHAFSLYAAKAVKDTVMIPVIGQNKLFVPETAEAAVADGSCDFIALGHALLADPEWPVKVKEGREEEIRYCIGCNNCLLSVNTAKYFRCSVNPWLMHEKDAGYRVAKAEAPKKVLVVGGGPAGMMAAMTAAEAGHDTELWEKADSLGGTIRAAGGPDFKNDLKRFAGYLENGLRKNNVLVSTGRKADADSIKAGGFDHVILAAGAVPKKLRIPGIDGEKVLDSIAYLSGTQELHGKVVILGGGLAGCESALQAAKTAEVTILEYLNGILKTGTEARNNGLAIRNRLADAGVKIVTSANVTAVTDSDVVYMHDGQEEKAPYDYVISAVGFVSENSLAEELETAGIPVTVIGDAKKPGKIRTGICEALFAVLDM